MPDDTLVPFSKAAVLFPDAWKPTTQTLYSWANKGYRGRKLRTVRIGGRRFTTAAYVAEFLRDDNDPLASLAVAPSPGPSPGQCEAVTRG